MFVPFIIKAQTEIAQKDGIVFTNTITKIKEDAKFVYYSATVKAVNNNDYDIFYKGPKNKLNPFFATIQESNSGTSFYFEGSASRLQLVDIPLYYLKPKDTFTTTQEFKVKKEISPIFKLDYINTFDKITDLK